MKRPLRVISAPFEAIAAMDSLGRLAFLAPILAFEIYLNATLVLFVSGLWPWPLERWSPVVAYLLVAHVCLLAGFLWSARSAPTLPAGERLTRRVVWAVIMANLLLLVPTTVSRTGELVPNVARAWHDYGEVYLASLELRASRTHPVEYIRVLVGYVLVPLVPLVVFYWPDMSRWMRVAGGLAVAWTLALGFAMGINKPIAEFVAVLVAFGSARLFSEPRPPGFRMWRRFAALTVVITIAGGLSFYRSQTERVGQTTDRTTFTIGSRVPDRYVRPRTHADPVGHRVRNAAPMQVIEPRRDHLLAESLPMPLVVFVERGALYLTQGYYALALALDLPWQPTWGAGHSFFVLDNAAEWFPGLRSKPYPMRLEAWGWDAYRSWSSFYPWVASDLSFGGTLILMFFIGAGAGASWRDTLAASSPFAVAAFACFLIVILYLPANNQMLQFGEGWTATWGILGAWLWTRRRLAGVPATSSRRP